MFDDHDMRAIKGAAMPDPVPNPMQGEAPDAPEVFKPSAPVKANATDDELGLHFYSRIGTLDSYEKAAVAVARELAAAQRERDEPARAFARWACQLVLDGYDLDGSDVQQKGRELGLLRAETRTATCGEECRCGYYGVDDVWDCYKLNHVIFGEGV